MAKRFRLRISRIIPSFNPCGSKEPSNPVPSFFRFSTVSPTVVLPKPKPRFPSTTTTTPTKPHRSSLKRHVSSAIMAVGCGRTRSKPTLSDYDDEDSTKSRDETFFQWEKQDKWHVIAKVYDYDVVETPRRKIYTSSVSGRSENESDDVLPPPPPPPSSAEKKKKKKKRRHMKKTTSSTTARSVLFRISTSSAESGLFSSEGFDDEEEDEDEETETLVSSSRSFSTDSSSEFNPHLETIREVALDNHPRRKKSKNKKKKKTMKRCVSNKQGRKSWSSTSASAAESETSSTPARLSMFQRMIPCTVLDNGKVRESFAVVKRSENPYEDFKRSMMEMILEKQMFDDKDLEQLLHCFLSLNSRDHHGIIVQAFSEIWEILFCSQRVSRAL